DLLVAVGATGDLPTRDAGEAGLVEEADTGLGARPAAVCEGFAGVQADRGGRGEHTDLRLPDLEPQTLVLDVEAALPVDRGDVETGTAQPLGDRVGAGGDELH